MRTVVVPAVGVGRADTPFLLVVVVVVVAMGMVMALRDGSCKTATAGAGEGSSDVGALVGTNASIKLVGAVVFVLDKGLVLAVSFVDVRLVGAVVLADSDSMPSESVSWTVGVPVFSEGTATGAVDAESLIGGGVDEGRFVGISGVAVEVFGKKWVEGDSVTAIGLVVEVGVGTI